MSWQQRLNGNVTSPEPDAVAGVACKHEAGCVSDRPNQCSSLDTAQRLRDIGQEVRNSLCGESRI
jgi:hypothetical protein